MEEHENGKDAPLTQVVINSDGRAKLYLNTKSVALRVIFGITSKRKRLEWKVNDEECYLEGTSDQINEALEFFYDRLNFFQMLNKSNH